jgi:hypothetical protein
MGLRRRILSSEVEAKKKLLRRILKEHIINQGPQGTTRSYGRSFLHAYMNSLPGDKAFSRNRIQSVLRDINASLIRHRYEEMQLSRGEYRIKGPDFVWLINGYYKVSAIMPYL